VILVGEMRSLETIAIALQAAETGHLVLATLHTNNAPQTVDRIVDVFPSTPADPGPGAACRMHPGHRRPQQLLPRADGKGRIPAVEVMIANTAIRNLIREGKSHQLYTIMQASFGEGMVTMDRALFELYKEGFVTWEEAYSRAIDQKEFATWRNRF
jgi:twitching motility protein PilT